MVENQLFKDSFWLIILRIRILLYNDDRVDNKILAVLIRSLNTHPKLSF